MAYNIKPKGGGDGCGPLFAAACVFPFVYLATQIAVMLLAAIGILTVDQITLNWIGLIGAIVLSCMLCQSVSRNEPERERLAAQNERQRAYNLSQKIAIFREQDQIREEWERTEEGQQYLHNCQEEEEQQRRDKELPVALQRWEQYFKFRAIEEISSMSGLEFESFIASLLHKIGFHDIVLTPINDQGADILCKSPDNLRIAIQTKRWKNRLGNGPIQEILGGITWYGCDRGMVITTADYTESAKKLAAKDSRITLCDGHWIVQMVEEHLSKEVPPFNWAIHDRMREEGRFEQFQSNVKQLKRCTLPAVDKNARARILAQLAAGEIKVEDAVRRLSGLS